MDPDIQARVRDAVRRIRDNDFADVPDALLERLAVAPIVDERRIAATRPVVVRGLSHREREVLQCVSHGLGDSEIGEVLGVSTDTVKSHLKRVRDKLAAKNRAHAVAVALREGMIG
jgi:DNA-binding CsgD family transcriptional regulator